MEEVCVLCCEEAVIDDEAIRVKLNRIHIQLRILLLANICDSRLIKILLQTLLVIASASTLVGLNLIQDIASARAVTQRGISSANPGVEEGVERTVGIHPAAIILEDDIVLLETLVKVGVRLVDTGNVAINEVNELVLIECITQNAQLRVRNLVVEGAAITLKVFGDASLNPLERKKRVLAKVACESGKQLLVQAVKMKTVILHILHKIYEQIDSKRRISAVTVCHEHGIVTLATHDFSGLYNPQCLKPFNCIDIYYKNKYMLYR